MFRFAQCRGIANRLTEEATLSMAASVQGDVGDDELRVVVYNPSPQPFEQVAELTLQIPEGWPTFNEFFGFEPKPAFRIYDAGGDEIPTQRIGQAMHRIKTRIRDTRFPENYYTDDITVSLPLRIPAMGYTTLTVKAGEQGVPTRHPVSPAAPGLATGARSMANAHLDVTIEMDGTLTLFDKESGESYSHLLTFEDTADIGDGWYHGPATNDQAFSGASSCSIALVHNGPLLTTFRIRSVMSISSSTVWSVYGGTPATSRYPRRW